MKKRADRGVDSLKLRVYEVLVCKQEQIKFITKRECWKEEPPYGYIMMLPKDMG